MTLDQLTQAEQEARRFLDRIAALRNRLATDKDMRDYFGIVGFKETAAVKRASMDLSRALVELRQ
jgi:hypothetical protein